MNKVKDIQLRIRNFCIIAHIDHGKSTLADRLLEVTGTVEKREMQEQKLDSNPIERERGITIKLAPVRMVYKPVMSKNQTHSVDEEKISNIKYQISNQDQSPKFEIGNRKLDSSDSEYILNLIDTPGHVDFSYEVSRSLAACEGAILVVDAAQGVQAQTLANLNLARKQKLTIIPIINKIDLPNAQIEKTITELISLGFTKEEILKISAKTGKHIDQVLYAVVNRIPAPQGDPGAQLRALVFSSLYDAHRGVVVYVRVVDGSLHFKNSFLKGVASRVEFKPIEGGYFHPQMIPTEKMTTGEVGFIATGLKDSSQIKIGDTITSTNLKSQNLNPNNLQLITHNLQPLPGYKEPKPMVFLGLYPIQSDEINHVREAMGKLRLSDSAFTFKPISSLALGHGFHCGFLGLLHAEVVQERLSREFGLNLIATAPMVEYRVKLKGYNSPLPSLKIREGEKNVSPLRARPEVDSGLRGGEGELRVIQSASEFPDPATIEQSFEPLMEVTIFSPKAYVGQIMQLCQDKRADFIDLRYNGDQATFVYLIPLSEMIIDFFDRLKSITEGYASMTYEFFDYQPVDLVKLDILLNHEKVDAFSQVVVAERALYVGRLLVDKLKDVIPRHQFGVPIQATIGGKIIARADVAAFRKDVTQKLYGGDRTRKDKLLEAQKKGKKRMKMVGRVEIPQEAFLKVFKSS